VGARNRPQRSPVRRYWWAIALAALGYFSVMAVAMFVAVAIVEWLPIDMAVMDEPQAADMAGTYHLTLDSQDFLRKVKHYATIPPSTIELRANGTLAIKDMPDCIQTEWGDPAGTFLSGSGTWTVGEEWPGFGLRVRPEGDGPAPWIFIRGFRQPYRLEIDIGDPDNGETITYVRGR
jgi:hypothetical protein